MKYSEIRDSVETAKLLYSEGALPYNLSGLFAYTAIERALQNNNEKKAAEFLSRSRNFPVEHVKRLIGRYLRKNPERKENVKRLLTESIKSVEEVYENLRAMRNFVED